MKNSLLYRLVAIMGTLLALAAGAHAQSTIRIGLAVPTYGPFAPVYAADELGYYKEHGIAAEITAYRGGPAAQEALAAGAADIIDFFPPGVALAAKKGIKEKIVGIGSAKPDGWHIVVMASSPFHTVADLAGKKIGITAKGATSDFYALWAAKHAGVQVETVPLGAPAEVPTLKSGQIDAAVLNPPVPFRLILSGEGRSLIDLGKEMDANLPDVWVATQALIDSNPKAVEGTLRAIYKATAYMQKNRAYGLDYMRRFTGEKDSKVAELDYNDVLLKRPTSAKIERHWLDASLALAALGGITDLPPIEQIFTDRFSGVNGD
ncbi:MAG TPA: ABC transporter substrate-binding protein [Xanthobacteraceae bacterium]|jgi:NitT/TauT family transport system substrate-binding protein